MQNKCDICGREFELLAENRYEVVDVEHMNILTGLKNLVRYNAFDCPYCGCQNRRGTFFPSASIPTANELLYKKEEDEV